jgi:hypothetical protein
VKSSYETESGEVRPDTGQTTPDTKEVINLRRPFRPENNPTSWVNVDRDEITSRIFSRTQHLHTRQETAKVQGLS